MSYCIQSLGGSGEDSRNCFLLCMGQKRYLLDCGVRRELHVPLTCVYPNLSRDLAASLDAVFLSHAHEDHTAALPYLYELGYRGPIYATVQTLNAVKSYLRKWTDYVITGGDVPPYPAANIDRLTFRPILLGIQNIGRVELLAGRSGHTWGSCWYRFSADGHELLYTGDFSDNSLSLETDSLPVCQTLVLECAYAGKTLNQSAQYRSLLNSIHRTIDSGGKVLLPVPANGRGCDLLLRLLADGINPCVERSILDAAKKLRADSQWTRPGKLWDMLDNIDRVPGSDKERLAYTRNPDGLVILTTDGMLSSAPALLYYNALKGDVENKFILTGHTAAGTVGASVFLPSFRLANGINAQTERIVIKVHIDETDAMNKIHSCRAKQVMLFHASEIACSSLVSRLTEEGIICRCGLGEKYMLEF